jgi:hypothetical protein
LNIRLRDQEFLRLPSASQCCGVRNWTLVNMWIHSDLTTHCSHLIKASLLPSLSTLHFTSHKDSILIRYRSVDFYSPPPNMVFIKSKPPRSFINLIYFNRLCLILILTTNVLKTLPPRQASACCCSFDKAIAFESSSSIFHLALFLLNHP